MHLFGDDVWLHMMEFLHATRDVPMLALTCKKLHHCANSNYLWYKFVILHTAQQQLPFDAKISYKSMYKLVYEYRFCNTNYKATRTSVTQLRASFDCNRFMSIKCERKMVPGSVYRVAFQLCKQKEKKDKHWSVIIGVAQESQFSFELGTIVGHRDDGGMGYVTCRGELLAPDGILPHVVPESCGNGDIVGLECDMTGATYMLRLFKNGTVFGSYPLTVALQQATTPLCFVVSSMTYAVQLVPFM